VEILISMKKKQKHLKSEGQNDIGNFSGAASFQGSAHGKNGNYGLGGKKQLAKPSDEETISERSPSDGFYRDLPGFPEMNSLQNKQVMVPRDPNEDEINDRLGPTIDGQPIDGVDTWKSTTPSKMGTAIYKTNSILAKKQFVPKDIQAENTIPESAGPSGVGSLGSTTWSSSKNALVKPKDFFQELEDYKNGDINAKNPVGTKGVIVRPTTHVPDNGDGKDVKFKENKINKMKFLKEMIDLLVEELLSEEDLDEAPQNVQAIIPGFLPVGQFIKDTAYLDQLHKQALKIADPNQTYPNRYKEALDNLKKELEAANIPQPMIKTIIDQTDAARQENIETDKKRAAGILSKPIAVQGKEQQRNKDVPKPLEDTVVKPNIDEMRLLKDYYEQLQQASPNMKNQIEQSIITQIKQLGINKVKNWVGSDVYNSFIGGKNIPPATAYYKDLLTKIK